MTNTNQNSTCCNAPVERGGNLNGTSYYVCDKCAQPCDVRANQNWEEEFEKQYFNLYRAEPDLRGRMRPVKPSDPRDELKSFIKKVEQQAKEQGRREGIEECILLLNGHKMIYKDGDRAGQEKGHAECEWNEAIDDAIAYLKSKLTEQHEKTD